MPITIKGKEVGPDKIPAKKKRGMEDYVETTTDGDAASLNMMAEATITAAKADATDEEVMQSLKKTTDALEATILNLGGEMVDPLEAATLEVKYNPSVARAVRRNGVLTRVHPFKLIINNKEVEVNDKIVHLINQILIDL